ncbi:Eukaryotic-type carbonic anhydrase [Popillia japonica]|uniref:Carbonic anhydrase n=1 Tax=Popillia japonica TaxID=7064 RepID=A0AAW1IZN9_POPJA
MNELIHLTLIIVALADSIITVRGQDFGYEGEEGPEHWGQKYEHCVGKHQSPINIDEHNVEEVVMLPLLYENFETESILSATNNGHTVQLRFESSDAPSVTGGPLLGEYQFAQMHFHWGANDEEGSENKINNQSFPMELHLLFYSSSYGSVKEASEHPDGLCVMAFLYRKSLEDNPNYVELITLLPQVNDAGHSVTLEKPITLNKLLPENRKFYYTYGGSLTTPPCTEVVTWIEFKDTIPLSHEQLETFRHLRTANSVLVRNFRPPQNLHGRIIRTNKDAVCNDAAFKNPWQNNQNQQRCRL